MNVPLALGVLAPDGYALRRSGVHWLCSDGHYCRPGEVVAYCNLAIEPSSLRRMGSKPFADEHVLQVAFAPRVGGRLQITQGASIGGYLNVLALHPWEAADTIATLETTDLGTVGEAEVGTLRRMMLAGRRMGWAVDVDTGLLPGWHSRARAWWDEPAAAMPTLLSLGICDVTSVVRGDRSGFIEMFEAAPIAAQMVTASEHPIAACAPVLLDQFTRTAPAAAAIRADIGQALATGGGPPTPEDCVFLGAVLRQLEASPIRERLEVLTTTGLRRQGPADAILLSLSAEPRSVLRHRRLGYRLNILAHNLRAAGPLARAWLRSSFEPVARSLEDIRRDYANLFENVGAETGAGFLVVNQMSTSAHEDISSYAAFDAPLGDTLASVSAKEMNLMLEDLAEEHNVAVVDLDAIAADIGGAEHLPDGIHQSGALQARLRAEIFDILAGPLQSMTNSTIMSATPSTLSGAASF